jgi:hypothetical protein
LEAAIAVTIYAWGRVISLFGVRGFSSFRLEKGERMDSGVGAKTSGQ